MKKAIATLKSLSPYGQNKFIQVEKKAKELADDYEKRTWRERMHCNESGEMFIPASAFKNCIAEAAKFIGQQVPGMGKCTWTKHFEAGIMVVEPLMLGVKKDDVPGHWQHVPADGKRGGSRRVMKCFPYVEKWGGDVEFIIVDNIITEDAFKYHIEQAGSLIGIGVYRPRNCGYWGRFSVEKIKWTEE